MSLYMQSVDQITPADLDELLKDSAVENVRLEFKSQDVSKDEALKKLTSFANTFGGYMIIGAEANADGRLVGLPGVDPVSGFKQRMVAWGYGGASPPLQLFVSDPISSPQDATRVCYVIYVPESEETPHFINDRKGVYIRTDEFSQRFEPQLATYEEIQHLANRRAITVARRESQVTPPNLVLSVCPKFPSKALMPHAEIPKLLNSCRVAWRSTGFPKWSEPITQHESTIILEASGLANSLLEINIWGLLFYAYDILDKTPRWPGQTEEISGIHLYSLVGHILVSLEHAKSMYDRMGFDGSLLVRTKLDRIRGISLLSSDGHNWLMENPASPLDDSVEFDMVTTSTILKTQRDELAADIARILMFALNRADVAANDDAIKKLLAAGYKFNYWQ